jgi:hypothetical protein
MDLMMDHPDEMITARPARASQEYITTVLPAFFLSVSIFRTCLKVIKSMILLQKVKDPFAGFGIDIIKLARQAG